MQEQKMNAEKEDAQISTMLSYEEW